MNKHTLYPILSAILSGIYYVCSEFYISFFQGNPTFMAIVINICGGLFLIIATKNKKKEFQKIKKKDYPKIVIAGLFIGAIPLLLIYQSIELIGSSKASFLSQSEHIFVLTLAIIFLKERFNLKEIWGLLLILLGVILINFQNSNLSLVFGLGELYALIMGFTIAIGIIIITNIIKKYSASLITGIEMLISGIILSPAAFFVSFQTSPISIFFLILIGLLVAIVWLTYTLGLKHLGASKTAILYSTKAFFTLIVALSISKLIPSSNLIIPLNLLFLITGGTIISLGIVVLEIFKPRKKLSK